MVQGNDSEQELEIADPPIRGDRLKDAREAKGEKLHANFPRSWRFGVQENVAVLKASRGQ